MLESLLLFPILAGCVLIIIPYTVLRRWLLIGVGAGHVVLTAMLLKTLGNGIRPSAFSGLLAPDYLGALFLMLASVLFLAAAIYSFGYLRDEEVEHTGHSSTNSPEGRFACFMCMFLAAMTLVTTTPHLGALWVGIELTTLASTPLIYFHQTHRSLEATWKYLMICSVGIALALIGNILLSAAFMGQDIHGMDQLSEFIRLASAGVDIAQKPWLQVGFVFMLVGYGTKMGLAPMHTWLPDAHSEAPSMVSAMLSGALLNCAFLGILRGHQVMIAADMQSFSSPLLIGFGIFSLVIAMLFIVGQGHYKRLLAYSSVEHMGILALGVGIGGMALYGSMLHAVCHSLTKCAMFLLAGNILTRYRTLSAHDVHGLRYSMPLTATLWTAGFFAIVGTPPFGLFVSELTIARGIFDSSAPWLIIPYLGTLTVIFIGMSIPVFRMVQSPRPVNASDSSHESVFRIAPSMVFLTAILCLGLYVPEWLRVILNGASEILGGSYAF